MDPAALGTLIIGLDAIRSDEEAPPPPSRPVRSTTPRAARRLRITSPVTRVLRRMARRSERTPLPLR